MGFLDKILKGLGFEGEDKPPAKKTAKSKSDATYNGVGAEYNFKEKIAEKNEGEEVLEEKNDNIGVVMKNPTTQKEVQEIIDSLKVGATIIVNLTGFSATDRIRALDFLAGALYTLGGKLQVLEGNLYLVSVE